MLVAHAKAQLREWVAEQTRLHPEIAGAYTTGSINWLPDNAELAASSDVDVWLVGAGDAAPRVAVGKRAYRGLIIDASLIAFGQLPSADAILGDYHLAPAFWKPNVVFDPTGRLATLQAAVAASFADTRWVRERCAHARDNVIRNVRSIDEAPSLVDAQIGCLFAAGVTAHVLLTAGLRNPTVRTRYIAVRELLAQHDRLDIYDTLLSLLGCLDADRGQTERHLASTTEAFELARSVAKTPFPFSADISEIGRAIAIDGSRELIERGDHRGAMFWIAVTAARCRKILLADAPDLITSTAWGHDDLFASLGMGTADDLRARGAMIAAELPDICAVAESISRANGAAGRG